MGDKKPTRAVFFDRDGTLIRTVPYLSDPSQVRVLPEALDWVREAKKAGFLAVVVSNQSGVARGLFGVEEVERVNAKVQELFTAEGAPLDAFYYCPHAPAASSIEDPPCTCRKPAPGMIEKACTDLSIDPARSAVIGDSSADLRLGPRAGLAASFDATFEGDRLLGWIRGEFRGHRRYPLSERKNLVTVDRFARLPAPDDLRGWPFLSHLPDLLAARDLKRLVAALRGARDGGKLIGWALGGHVVKAGLAPYVNALIREGFMTLLACNGAFPVHDLEIAMAGGTSEDVGSSLNAGDFGMARETGDAFAEILERGARGPGFGKAVGEYIHRQALPHRASSVCAAAEEAGIPLCVFPAMGAEITAMHPGHSGAALGRASEIDFKNLVDALPRLAGGGVWLNVGSAVILPEVFLKALNLAVNLFGPIEDYTTANLDMIQHYRPRVNVVERPASKGIAITGHHEILIPLLYFGLHEGGL
jgi:histidinol-phosphate phosphatase family protein